jgi:hypothetical protein
MSLGRQRSGWGFTSHRLVSGVRSKRATRGMGFMAQGRSPPSLVVGRDTEQQADEREQHCPMPNGEGHRGAVGLETIEGAGPCRLQGNDTGHQVEERNERKERASEHIPPYVFEPSRATNLARTQSQFGL